MSELLLRLHKVEGDSEKTNEIILYKTFSNDSLNVIYFGGDMQDYTENMDADYSEWSLEKTARIINKKYTGSNVWVVKPSRMIDNTYSCYDNFVKSASYGIPTRKASQRSWHHLKALLHNGFQHLLNNTSYNNLTFDDLCELPLYLVGFSKGCVVLNQLLYDLSKLHENSSIYGFVRQVKKVVWLDGGHSGSADTWITSPSLLQTPVHLGVHFESHVTPYQINDPRRPWIGKEYLKFVHNLRSLNANLIDKLHFKSEPASLFNHFSILNEF